MSGYLDGRETLAREIRVTLVEYNCPDKGVLQCVEECVRRITDLEAQLAKHAKIVEAAIKLSKRHKDGLIAPELYTCNCVLCQAVRQSEVNG